MGDTSGLSEEQILANFYETQTHSTESENVSSESESKARGIQMLPQRISGKSKESMQDECEETVIDSKSDSLQESETNEETPQVSAGPSAIQTDSQSPGPSFHQSFSQAESREPGRRSTASAPPIYGNKQLQTIKKRPSTSKSFRRKLTGRDFKRQITQPPSKSSRRRNSAPNTRRQETENSNNFPHSSTTGRASTAGPCLRILTPESVIEIDSNSEEAPSTPPQSRIGSAKLAVRNRLANLIRAEMTMRGMKDDVRRNLFAPSLQFVEATLFLGSLVFMIPFTLQIRNGEYSLEGSILRTAISGALLLSSTLLQASTTYASVKSTSVTIVLSVISSVDNMTLLLVLSAFGYSVLFCRSRFESLFKTFSTQFFLWSVQVKGQRLKAIMWTLLPFLFCIAMGNWIAWGANTTKNGLGVTFNQYHDNELSSFLFSTRIFSNKSVKFLFTCLQMFFHAYAHCVIMYTELLMWAASLTIYWMEKKKRAYCNQESVDFDLVEGTSLFRDLLDLVNKRLSKPLGPLLAVSCISLVTYNVSGLTILCFSQWRWHILIVMAIKAGYVLIAAEATANDENLLHQILTKRIRQHSAISADGSDAAAIMQNRSAFESQLREFKDSAREPMALKALDFANMNYALFGWVLVSAIGYFLVVAEWLKDEYSKPNGCDTSGT